jgi:hypothetical protein
MWCRLGYSQIPKDMQAQAIAKVGDRSEGLRRTTLQAPTAATAEEDYSNVPCIRVVGRLNDKHKLNWLLPVKQTMQAFKCRAANTYGLSDVSTINIVFDGEKLGDTDTAEALALEDDYMLDIRVSRRFVFSMFTEMKVTCCLYVVRSQKKCWLRRSRKQVI